MMTEPWKRAEAGVHSRVGTTAQNGERDMAEINPKNDLKLARGLVIAKVLAARTPEACDRAAAYLNEWITAFPDDMEMLSYGSMINRMASALKYAETQAP